MLMPKPRFLLVRTLAVAAASAAFPARADWQLNLPPGVTEISRDIYDLHMLVLWVCVVIAALVFSVLIYALIAFRRKAGVKPATWNHSTAAEIIWTTIPVVVLVFLAVPSAKTLAFIEDTRDSELTIKITGYQWMWNYEYLDEGVNFFSTLAQNSNLTRRRLSGIDPYTVENYLREVDRPLVLPAGVKIRYLITSNDVIHAWWVIDFGVKRDAVPGYLNEGWFRVDKPGTYRGQCAEICGKDHGFMPIVVEVLPKDEFDAWLAAQKGGQAVTATGT
jgi:cytochrome c oxidase subunit II